MKINKYPDGTSYVTNDVTDVNKIYTFRVNSYEDLWHLNQFVDSYNNEYSQKPTITIPNLIDAQADRRFEFNQSSGLKLVLKFLNGMKANFKIFHPHNAEVVEALMNNVEIIDNSGFIKKVLFNLSGNTYDRRELIKVAENTVLMSSDAGGFKPLMKLCNTIDWKGETFSASKYRYPDTSELVQRVDRIDFKGKDVLIIDDISVYGGTFKGLSKLLKQRNCGKLYLAVSHMTIQNLGEDPVTNYFDKVFTTNSKFDNYFSKYKKYEGDKIDPLIYETIDIHKTPDNLEIIKLF